jgi:hypothetical protein
LTLGSATARKTNAIQFRVDGVEENGGIPNEPATPHVSVLTSSSRDRMQRSKVNFSGYEAEI